MDREKEPLVIFGINSVQEKLKSAPQEVFELMIVKSHGHLTLSSIDEEARRMGLRVRYVDSKVLNLLAEGQRHQGIAARVAPYPYRAFDDLLQELSSPSAQERVLILDGFTDPRNFGAVLRCAESAGVRHVVIPKDRSVAVTPTVVKSSAGAVHYLKIYRVPNLTRMLQALKERGFWIIGLDGGATHGVYDRAYPERVAVVLGSEGSGIRPLIRQECDFLVSIPMLGKVASLNVAVAGGIFLYELVRQSKPL